MSNTNLIGSCEVTLNFVLKRLSKLDGKNKKALEGEFREWINSIGKDSISYNILYLKKIY
tara:strand:+ start:357 stop:536 length:180 start_codon:yes stop_codon:yes gene_type:complete